MYEQILTNKDGKTVKILSHHQGIYIISRTDHKSANNGNFTKEDLIAYGWIFPVETEKRTPKLNEKYYIPNFTDEDKHDYGYWINDELDKYFLANNLICRTKKEAIALTDKMLGAVRV